MNKKTTLTRESYELYKHLIECLERTTQGSAYYERLMNLKTKAGTRNDRRHKKELREGFTVVNKVGRPTKENKKQSIHVKLPPYLISWMDRQPESRPVLMETALCSYYQIPDHIKES